MAAAGLIATLTCAALGGSFACEGQILEPSNGNRLQVELLAPTRLNFERVADAMQPHCGTLDCHGQIGRNLRLFGGRGLRLAPNTNPVDGDTTAVEYDATFWSVVGLEPEALTAVLTDNGADPERLSLIRKARGHERHKGGTLMNAGDNLDQCLNSWLTAQVLEAPCRAAAMYEPPVPVIAP
ncbi:MAG: hypothetical protein QOI66_2437 [Myxococcales bacterium]|nr:hypothetical protein [Myxococcales bacterium]